MNLTGPTPRLKTRKRSVITLVILLLSFSAFAQQYTQTVRGKIIDNDSQLPLPGASIIIIGSDPLIGTTSGQDGRFRLEDIEIGRVSLAISYIGYEERIRTNVVVNSGKEVVLSIALNQAFSSLSEVVVEANRGGKKGEALNEMSLISAQSISPEQSKRYAGGFNDPSRILSNLAGVTNSQNGENDIIVRGNSPKYIQWRLDGMEITNPTHFADQNAAKGGISALNNDLLATSDFHTGAFAPEFGNVLSGVYDVKLRQGNNEQFEAAFGFGALGTDLTLEGPFKKGHPGSYLINYRYSAIGLVSDLGLVDIDGNLNYQDVAFKIVLPSKRLGVVSLFGLGGASGFDLLDVDPQIQSPPGEGPSNIHIKEDYKKGNLLANVGMRHFINIGEKGVLNTLLSYSGSGIDEEVVQRDSILSTQVQSVDSRLRSTAYSIKSQYRHTINPKNKIQIGTILSVNSFNNKQGQILIGGSQLTPVIDFEEDLTLVRNHFSWRHRLNEEVSMVVGLHNVNILLTKESTIEPRLAFSWQVNTSNSLKLGYGKHSSVESIHNYFAQVSQADGSRIETNKNLELLKAHHLVMGYEKRFSKNLMTKVEVYYQHLYDLPVENLDTSYYATINESNEFRYVDLVNEGKGKNYGVELTLERYFNENLYFLINGSLYESKYTAKEGKERNTLYNGNYQLNFLLGKEWAGLGKMENKTLALNTRVFFGGGQKHIPLLRDSNGNLDVDPANGRLYDYDKAYEDGLDDIFQLDFTASYKINRAKATHELFLSLVNLTDNQGKISEYYDPSETDQVGNVTQFGTFPNLMYRVYF